jgi:3-deoxy-manno-octulosonate cytidylyltransferase (CMP-KDO synthetase)
VSQSSAQSSSHSLDARPSLPLGGAYTIIIPARLASSRLPNKALADIAGLPMIVRVAQRAAQSQAQKIVVATDSPLIQAACTAHGVAALITRTDHPSGSDRLAEACMLLNLSDEDIVVNVQGDEPLIDPCLIDAVANMLAANPHAALSTAAHPIQNGVDFHNPNVVKVLTDANGMALYFSRAPIPWPRDAAQQEATGQHKADVMPNNMAALRHVGIYAYRVGFLKQFPQLPQADIEQTEMLEQLRVLWHGHRIAVHITHASPGPGVDTPEDLALVRGLFKTT